MHKTARLISFALALLLVSPAVALAAPDKPKAEYKVGDRLPAKQDSAKSGYKETTWDDLIPPDWDAMRDFKQLDLDKLEDGDPRATEILERLRREWDKAPVNTALNGARIRIPGFVVPLESGREEVREFLLVPYFGACIHVPPPPANNTIHVFPTRAVKGIRSMDAVWVSGELTVEHSNTEWGAAGYRIKAENIVPYTESPHR